MRMGKAKWPSRVGWWAWSYFSDMRSYFPNVRVLIMWSREKPNGPGCWVDEGDHIFRIFRYHLVSPLDTIYSPTSRDSNTYPRKISTPNLCGIFLLRSKVVFFFIDKKANLGWQNFLLSEYQLRYILCQFVWHSWHHHAGNFFLGKCWVLQIRKCPKNE